MRELKNILIYVYINVKTSFNSFYTYKTASIITFLTQIILIYAQYFLWSAIFNNAGNVNNYTLNNMITYLVLTFSMGSLYPVNVSNKFGLSVKNGDIIHSLLRPDNIEYQLFTQSLGELVYKLVFISVPILITGLLFLNINISISIEKLTIVFMFWLSAYIFVFILELCVGVISYKTYCLWGINNLKSSIINILAGKVLPLNFYPALFRNIFYWLPFSTIYFVPINILMDKPLDNIIKYFIILWISICILASIYRIMSRVLMKKLMVQGG